MAQGCSTWVTPLERQAMSNLHDKDPFDGITKLDVKDAAPESFYVHIDVW